MSNVHTFADERAARVLPDLTDVDADLAAGVGDEMAAALARVAPLDDEPAPLADLLVEETPDLAACSPMEAQWMRFRDLFAEALEGGLYTLEALEQEISTGDAYFWPGRACAVVAKRVVYPNGEAVMQTQWAVGDLDEILALAPGIEAAARLVGCSRMLVEGRPGWVKALKPHGYQPWSVTLEKVL